MDIADPDELVTFAVDPTSGSHSFFTDYKNEDVIKWTHEAQEEFDDSKRAELYSKIQSQAAEDAFMVFLYYSDFTYLFSNKVKGFKVYPTGNYHLEEVTLEA
jgi:peptide/nickel transport system substrate-binding protein